MDQKYSCKGEIVVTVRTGSGLGGGSWSQMRTSHLRAAAGRAGPDWAGPGQDRPGQRSGWTRQGRARPEVRLDQTGLGQRRSDQSR